MNFILFDTHGKQRGMWTPGVENVPGEKRHRLYPGANFNVRFDHELPESVLAAKPLQMLIQCTDASHVRLGFRASDNEKWLLSESLTRPKPWQSDRAFGMHCWSTTTGKMYGAPAGGPMYQKFLVDYVHYRYGLTAHNPRALTPEEPEHHERSTDHEPYRGPDSDRDHQSSPEAQCPDAADARGSGRGSSHGRRIARDSAVVVTAEGPIFSAGIDVMSLAESQGSAGALNPARWLRRFAERLQHALDVIEATEVPVIGALQGQVIGMGLELVLSFDLRVASDDCRFAIPESRMGLVADVGGTTRLSRTVVLARTRTCCSRPDRSTRPRHFNGAW